MHSDAEQFQDVILLDRMRELTHVIEIIRRVQDFELASSDPSAFESCDSAAKKIWAFKYLTRDTNSIFVEWRHGRAIVTFLPSGELFVYVAPHFLAFIR